MGKKLNDMTSKELVTEYNRLAAGKGKPAVKRFAARKDAVKRIQALKAAPKKARAAKPPKEEKRSKLGIEFGVRHGSKREKLVDFFGDNYRKMLPTGDLLAKMYGSKSPDNKGALTGVLLGMSKMITKGKLGYDLRKEKNADKEICFGLYPK